MGCHFLLQGIFTTQGLNPHLLQAVFGMLWPGRASPSAPQLLAFSPGKEQAAGVPLDCKEIQPVHSEGDQPWDFFGRTDAKAETPTLVESPSGARNPPSLLILPGLLRSDRGGLSSRSLLLPGRER